jgi:hypothetical protein
MNETIIVFVVVFVLLWYGPQYTMVVVVIIIAPGRIVIFDKRLLQWLAMFYFLFSVFSNLRNPQHHEQLLNFWFGFGRRRRFRDFKRWLLATGAGIYSFVLLFSCVTQFSLDKTVNLFLVMKWFEYQMNRNEFVALNGGVFGWKFSLVY